MDGSAERMRTGLREQSEERSVAAAGEEKRLGPGNLNAIQS